MSWILLNVVINVTHVVSVARASRPGHKYYVKGSFVLLLPLVNLCKQELEQFLERLRLDAGNELVARRLLLLLVVLVDLLQSQFPVQRLDLLHSLGIVLAVVRHQHLLLLRRYQLEGLAHEPGALGVLDVGADLAQHLGRGEGVEDVVLDLEVFAEAHGDGVGLGVQVRFGRVAAVGQGQGAADVEGVVARLVPDASLVAVQGEAGQIERGPLAVGVRGAVGVDVLPDLGLEGRVDEQLEELDVRGALPEVAAEGLVNENLEEERVVDGIVLRHVRVLVPARGAAAGDGPVHDVVGNEEEGLEPLHLPAEDGGVEELLVGQGPALEDLDALDDREAARHLPTRDGRFEAFRVVRRELLLEAVRKARQVLEVPDQLRLELIEHLEEGILVGGAGHGDGLQ